MSITIGLLIPLLDTMLGTAFVFYEEGKGIALYQILFINQIVQQGINSKA